MLINETNLYYKVVEYIRRYYKNAFLCAGLGELQDTSEKKGYMFSQPDLTIMNLHKQYSGFTIELKMPTVRKVQRKQV